MERFLFHVLLNTVSFPLCSFHCFVNQSCNVLLFVPSPEDVLRDVPGNVQRSCPLALLREPNARRHHSLLDFPHRHGNDRPDLPSTPCERPHTTRKRSLLPLLHHCPCSPETINAIITTKVSKPLKQKQGTVEIKVTNEDKKKREHEGDIR